MEKVHISGEDLNNDESTFFTKAPQIEINVKKETSLNEANQAASETSQKAVESQDHDQILDTNQTATSTIRIAEGKLSQAQKRKFQSTWLALYPYLRYEPREGLMFCDICIHFSGANDKNGILLETLNFFYQR